MKLFSDHYSWADKMLHRLAFSTTRLQCDFSELERKKFGKNYLSIKIDKPVFITGLPRAGTTVLLELCAGLDEFATHCYRDMPFVLLPLFWDEFSKKYRKQAKSIQRAHADGLSIDFDSPEGFEEIIWKTQCKQHYQQNKIAPWTSEANNDLFEFLSEHMKKIIKLRQNNQQSFPRYISKNNMNIARVEWLLQAFPNALFVIPIREPLQHAASMFAQHQRFLAIHKQDRFAKKYMQDIGHFDFGANFRPINFQGWQNSKTLQQANSLSFWLEYWLRCYQHLSILSNSRVKLFCYESFCQQPEQKLAELAEFLQIDQQAALLQQAKRIKPPVPHQIDLTALDKKSLQQANAVYAGVIDKN